ncbi:winged helix-turn-helix domain-containing protein [Streptomyces sp. BV286]|uniref:winged helix-turn-helix domain-containing protein n=1 Tax=Streptomyces sp. BV286 TaxID=2849672 RepID=UPI001C2E1BF4|nr:winged helix-turn-helix domain-containing protein [Streptomyces sp. BV286]
MGVRVLLIEDDDTIAEPLAEGLGHFGLTVDRVSTGTDGLRGPYGDAVLLDLGLPDMDGIDVCRGIRQVSDVPIIILSARGEETDRVLGLELGADDYLAKPFSLRELVARLRAVTRRTQLGRGVRQGHPEGDFGTPPAGVPLVGAPVTGTPPRGTPFVRPPGAGAQGAEPYGSGAPESGRPYTPEAPDAGPSGARPFAPGTRGTEPFPDEVRGREAFTSGSDGAELFSRGPNGPESFTRGSGGAESFSGEARGAESFSGGSGGGETFPGGSGGRESFSRASGGREPLPSEARGSEASPGGARGAEPSLGGPRGAKPFSGESFGEEPFGGEPFSARREAPRHFEPVPLPDADPDPDADAERPPPGPLVVDRRTRQVWVGETSVALTPKEFELLALLTEDPGAVYSRQQILDRVWDPHYQGPTKTLDVHVATLRRKLGHSAWIQTLRGVGFRLAVHTQPPVPYPAPGQPAAYR